MKFASIKALPAAWRCNTCGAEKPPAQMVMRRRRGEAPAVHIYHCCKACRNARINRLHAARRGEYQRAWRRRHRGQVNAYARDHHRRHHEKSLARHRGYFRREHAAILIRARLKTRGIRVTAEEARRLLHRYGPAYPLRAALSPAGAREAARIKARSGVSMREAILIAIEDSAEFRAAKSTQPRVQQVRADHMKRLWRTGVIQPRRRTA